MKYTEVFVPGGFPRHTYNPRDSQQLESPLRSATENLCKLVTVTGHTKSGKTVLVRTVFPRETSVWIDGGTIGSEDDSWTTVLDQLNLFDTSQVSTTSTSNAAVSASAKAGANFLIAKGEGELGGSYAASRGRDHTQSRSVSAKVAAIKGLRESHTSLVFDDLHYIP